MSFAKLPEIFEGDPMFQEADRGSQEPKLVLEVKPVAIPKAKPVKVKLTCHLDQE